MIRLSLPVSHAEGDMSDVCWSEIENDYIQHTYNASKTSIGAVKVELQARIRSYIIHRGNPVLLGASPFPRSPSKNGKNAKPAAKTAGDYLFDRYRSGASTDKDIVAHARKVQVGFCPYCGLSMRRKPDDESPDRDHVLPRSLFPEFSLLRLNIVEACDDCNKAKSSDVFDDDGNWKYIHPYFDIFLAAPVLCVSIKLKGDNLVPTFQIRQDLPSEIGERVKRHFRYMDLANRYADDPLREIVNLIEHHKGFIDSEADIPRSRKVLRVAGYKAIKERVNDPVGHALLALSQSSLLSKIMGL